MKPPIANIKSCIEGDQRAQKELYEDLKARVMGICYRYGHSKENAEDIFQDAIIRVFHNLQKALHVDNFLAWVTRITVNTAISHFKKSGANMMVELNSSKAMDYTSHEVDVLESLQASEILDLLYQLPDHYRVVFNLYMIEGYPHKDIAQQLDIAESTSRVMLTRARKRMIELIQKKTYYENVAG